jgi:hypothetical protein
MNKRLHWLLSLWAVLACGCFNVTDELTIESGGGGTFSTRIDATRMMEMMKMMETMVPDSAMEDPGLMDMNLKDSLMKTWTDLEKTPGISEVKRTVDGESVFTISFRFNDVVALNRALASRSKDSLGNPKDPTSYSLEKGRLVCNLSSLTGMGDALKGLGEMPGAEADSSAMNMEMLKMMLGEMKYTSIHRVPGKVVDYTNKKAKLSPDGRTVTLEIDLLDQESTHSMHNDIKFK